MRSASVVPGSVARMFTTVASGGIPWRRTGTRASCRSTDRRPPLAATSSRKRPSIQSRAAPVPWPGWSTADGESADPGATAAFAPSFVDSAFEMSVLVIGALYLVAAIFNLYVPDTGVDHKPLKNNPLYLIHDFNHSLKLLWRDKLGQISLAVTTLFWGAGATLQFIVIKWAEQGLALDLSRASMLQGIVAIGVALGAVAADRKS